MRHHDVRSDGQESVMLGWEDLFARAWNGTSPRSRAAQSRVLAGSTAIPLRRSKAVEMSARKPTEDEVHRE